jgi:tetratricopeptide (TPR) repeat protein
MRALVKDLTQRRNDGEDLSIEFRGQQVDPVKMQRWRKRHGRIKDVVHLFSSNTSMGKSSRLSDNSSTRSTRLFLAASSNRNSNNTAKRESPMEASDSSPLNSPTEGTEPSRVTDESKSRGFDHWDLVDVPGSPLLSRLFEALKIECESSIPSLDLASPSPVGALLSTQEEELDVEMNGDINAEEWIDFSTGPGSKDLIRYSREVFQMSDTFSTNSNPGLVELSFSEWSFREWDFSRGQPLKMNIRHIFGLSPFPASSETRRHGISHYGNTLPHAQSQSMQDKEIVCKYRVRRLKKILGVENPKTLAAMKDLGAIYDEQSEYRQAELVYRQIAISYQKILGLNHVTTLSAYLDVAETLGCLGKSLQCHKIHQRIHDTIIKLVDLDDQLALRSNSIRTLMLYRFGQLGEAEKLSRQTFQIELSTLGPMSQQTLYDMGLLGETFRLCGKLVEAEQLLRINILIYREVKGLFSVEYFDSINCLADIFLDQKRYDECKDLAMMFVERLEPLVGQEHETILHSRYIIAVSTWGKGDLVESERQLRIVLQRYIKIFGEKDPDTCEILGTLAGVLGDMGHYSEAVTLREKSYQGLVESLGMSNASALESCRQLGDLYEKLGHYKDAIALLQRTVDGARNPWEKPTKALLKTIFKLAKILQKIDRCTEAISLYEECFHGFIEICGPSDDWTITSIAGLGLCYEGLRRYDDAFALYQQSIDQVRSFEGDEHPAFVTISKWITELRERLAASGEDVDESQDDSDGIETSDEDVNERQDDLDRMETLGVEQALIDEGNVNTDDRLAKGDVPPAEKDWMGELFDFDLFGNAPSDMGISNEDAQENKK